MPEPTAEHLVKVSPNWDSGMPPASPGRTVTVSIDDHGYNLDQPGADDLIARLAAARHEAWPPPGPVTRRECPLPSCTWFHDEPDWPLSMALIPEPTVDQLEEARRLLGSPDADPVRDANLARLLAHTWRIESILRDHFRTHPLEDWVLEVVRLRAMLDTDVEGRRPE